MTNTDTNPPPPADPAVVDPPPDAGVIANRDQDPNDPANNTLSPPVEPIPRPVAEGVTVPPEELLTEQEKLAAGGGDPTAGVGPLSPSEVSPGPVETSEDELERIASAALHELPEKIREHLERVPIMIDTLPSEDIIRDGFDPRVRMGFVPA